MKTAHKKLIKLEGQVLDEWPKRGSTCFCTCGSPKPEQIAIEELRKAVVAEIPYAELSPSQKVIINKAIHLVHFRIIDLFGMMLEGQCQGDKTATSVLWQRILWFLDEIREEIKQQLEVSEIERKASPDSEVDEVDEYFRKAPECFTQDAYDKIQMDVVKRLIKEGKLKLPSKKQLNSSAQGDTP